MAMSRTKFLITRELHSARRVKETHRKQMSTCKYKRQVVVMFYTVHQSRVKEIKHQGQGKPLKTNYF